MKLIKLNESQYKRLFEMDSFVKTGGNDDGGQNSITDYQTHDEVPITSKLDGKDGEVKDSKVPDALGDDPRLNALVPPTNQYARYNF